MTDEERSGTRSMPCHKHAKENILTGGAKHFEPESQNEVQTHKR